MIRLVNLRKNFGTRWVTNGLNLEIPTGKMTVIIGRSGEGKSVLLKQIIGLIKPTSGQVLLDGIDITKLNDAELNKVFEQFGYVFQFAALLDSLSVYQNIGISLLEEGENPAFVRTLVEEKLSMVNLPVELMDKYPSELSGGQKKRVGLARTLVRKPRILLYDEPTTGLDPITSRVIHELMFDMQKKLNITSVVISHDVEIFNYADYVALLHEGTIKYHGDAKAIWESDNPYIFQFIRGLSEGPIQTEIAHQPSQV